jgi:hypothetical protein
MGRVDGASGGPERPVVRPEDMRAGHADRERVLDRLRRAHVEGRIDVQEFDERIAATLAARTYGELAAVTVDLPADPGPPAAVEPVRPAAAYAHDPAADLRSGASAWAAASATTMAIWVVGCIASGGLMYPWFLWVAGPWGVVLLATWLGLRLHGR